MLGVSLDRSLDRTRHSLGIMDPGEPELRLKTQHEDEPRQVRFFVGSGSLEELARQQDTEQADE